MPKKCKVKKKNGEPCGADAQSGKDLCVFHDPTNATDGQIARRAGGINRISRAVVLPKDTPDHSARKPFGRFELSSLGSKLLAMGDS